MDTLLLVMFEQLKELDANGKERIQKARSIVEDMQSFTGKRRTTGVKSKVSDAMLSANIPEAVFLQRLLDCTDYADAKTRMKEIFLADHVYESPKGADAFIRYMYYRALSEIAFGGKTASLSVHFIKLLPTQLREDFLIEDDVRPEESEIEETEPEEIAFPHQELHRKKALRAKERLEASIEGLDSHELRRHLRDVQNGDIAVALLGIEEGYANKVLENLSKRLASMIVEDMRFMGELKESEITESMDRMVVCMEAPAG